MPWTFVNKLESASGSSYVASYNATLPGSLVVGNLLVMAVAMMYTNSSPPNAIAGGWKSVYNSPTWGFGSFSRLGVLYRVIDGTETNPLVSNDSGVGVLYATGIAQYHPAAALPFGLMTLLDGAGVNAALGSGSTTASPAYTTNVANSMVLHFGTGSDNVAYTLSTAGNVQRFDAINTGGVVGVTMCEVQMPTAGTLAAGTWSRSSGAQPWMGEAVALLAAPIAIPAKHDLIAVSGSRRDVGAPSGVAVVPDYKLLARKAWLEPAFGSGGGVRPASGQTWPRRHKSS